MRFNLSFIILIVIVVGIISFVPSFAQVSEPSITVTTDSSSYSTG